MALISQHFPINSSEDEGNGIAVITKKDVRTKKPSLYKVLILNDDFTPMEFVVDILKIFFAKTHEDATEIMLSVHNKGRGVCGVYSHDIAETKSKQVNEAARQAGHPLQSVTERA